MTEDMNQAQPTMAPPESGVKVRMYRPQGLGDCFLLAFRANDGSARYMLIDCGVFFATKGGPDRMKKIAADIAQATGRRLHVLIVTHEHWDHYCGFHFRDAREVFQEIKVDELWTAWTEDAANPKAQRLRENRSLALTALSQAVTRLKEAGEARFQAIQAVLDFSGELLAEAAQESGIIGRLSKVWTEFGKLKHCYPGDPPTSLPGVQGIKIYVLGPPQDEALLSRSNPSRVDSEVYERGLALNETTALYGALLEAKDSESLSPDERALLELNRPFDPSYRINIAAAADNPAYREFFREHYGFHDKDQGPAWRRIAVDWLGAAGMLALRLDEDTNNTSLVLAIELAETGRVLLFPADAQVGNWLSWHNVSWPPEEGRDGQPVTGTDLLRRTVLYKVGHHGSHNATLREKGLELMQSPELVAMIPVDQKQADEKEWAMPFPPLYKQLEEKTRGRILRADEGLPQKPDAISSEEWENFLARAAEDTGPDKLWVEYTILE